MFAARAPRGYGRDQAAFFVPLEGLGGVFAAELLDRAIVAVVLVRLSKLNKCFTTYIPMFHFL